MEHLLGAAACFCVSPWIACILISPWADNTGLSKQILAVAWEWMIGGKRVRKWRKSFFCFFFLNVCYKVSYIPLYWFMQSLLKAQCLFYQLYQCIHFTSKVRYEDSLPITKHHACIRKFLRLPDTGIDLLLLSEPYLYAAMPGLLWCRDCTTGSQRILRFSVGEFIKGILSPGHCCTSGDMKISGVKGSL